MHASTKLTHTQGLNKSDVLSSGEGPCMPHPIDGEATLKTYLVGNVDFIHDDEMRPALNGGWRLCPREARSPQEAAELYIRGHAEDGSDLPGEVVGVLDQHTEPGEPVIWFFRVSVQRSVTCTADPLAAQQVLRDLVAGGAHGR